MGEHRDKTDQTQPDRTRVERIRAALATDDWRIKEAAVQDLIEALRATGELSTEESNEFIDQFCDPKMKWEVKRAMAKGAPRLPIMWAATVLSRLIKDASSYVRQAAQKAKRQIDQAAISEDEDLPRNNVAEDLVARAIKVGGDEAAQVINEVLYNAHSLAMDEFAHELANIIQQVQTPMKMLNRGLGNAEKERVAGPIKDLRAAVRSLTSFTDELRWLARGRELTFEKTNADEVIRAVVMSVKPVRGVQIRAPQIKDLQFDGVHSRLVRALTNILKNAVEASPNKGVVVIEAYRADETREIVFTITDQGTGIPVDQREDIFRLGRTSKRNQGHSGLGLYVARKVVVAEHGGLIVVDDGVQRGTVFQIRLPITAAARRRSSSNVNVKE